MTYLDTSVALAHLLGEDRHPPDQLWHRQLIASKLLEYELWTRINAYRLEHSHEDDLLALIARVALVKLEPAILARALQPFPEPVRTLDALHLSTISYLLEQGQSVELASYDQRMIDTARAFGWSIADCG